MSIFGLRLDGLVVFASDRCVQVNLMSSIYFLQIGNLVTKPLHFQSLEMHSAMWNSWSDSPYPDLTATENKPNPAVS